MAKCDEGYRCDVCGGDVENIDESDLYLRFVIGQVDPETLHTISERHIRCNPVLAQYIVDDRFEAAVVDGPFAKSELDSEYVAQQEQLVTAGWRRLLDVVELQIPITEYPLPEVIEKWRK